MKVLISATGKPRSWNRMVAVACVLTCLAGIATGRQEQWLGYRTSPEAEKVVGALPGQELTLLTDRPANVKLPELNSAKPLFARWQSPLLPDGSLWLVLDSSPRGRYELLLIDSDADGDMTDEQPLKAHTSAAYGQSQSARFRGVKVLLAGEDGPVGYHLNLSFWLSGDKMRLTADSAGWYEGQVNVAGDKFGVSLFDADANGLYSDAHADVRRSDRVKIVRDGRAYVLRAGKYAQVEGKFHRLVISPDGAFVKIWPAAEQELVTVAVPKGLASFSAGGPNGLFRLVPADGKVALPAGKYQLSQWEMKRRDKALASWELVGVMGDDAPSFEVTKSGPSTLELDVGEPLVGHVSVQKRGSTCYFSNPRLVGRNDERITLTRNGQQPPPPGLRIVNADKTYNRRFTFEYG